MLTVCILVYAAAAAQTRITFTGAVSSNWNTPGNWNSNVVPNGNDANDTLYIQGNLAGSYSAYITGTVTLSGVKIFVPAGSTLQIGTGNGSGANHGELVLDNASAISLQYDGTNRGSLKSNATGNSANMITLGGTTIFQGGTTYNTNTGSGAGVITGPAHADASTSGFAFGSLPVIQIGRAHV